MENMPDGAVSGFEPALGESADMLGLVFTIVIYFLVLGLIIWGVVYFRRYMRTRVYGAKPSSGMRIRDRLVIAQDKQIIMLEVRDKVMLIGISAQSMSALGEFEKDELHDGADENGGRDFAGGDGDGRKESFLGIISEKIKTGFDGVGKDKKN